MLTRKLPCPSCGVRLKIADDLPAGKKITCPKCGEGFPVPEGNGQAAPQAEAVISKRKPTPEEPEEYGEQDEVANEEVEERPVVRKRRRSPPPEDEDEQDDEEEERPLQRKRRKFRKKKQPSRLPLILGLVIGGLLLLGAIAAAIIFLPPLFGAKENKSDSVARNNAPSRPSRMLGGAPEGAGPASRTDERANSPEGGKPAEPRPSESGSDNASDPYAAGKQVFQRTCARCHRIGDSGGGRQGPDLATIGRTRDADWVMGYVRDPQSRKPESRMRAIPPQRLSDEDLRAVAVYLASLK